MITLPLSSKRGCLKKNYHYNYQNKRIMAAQPDRQMRLSPGNTSTIFKNIFFSLWNNGLQFFYKWPYNPSQVERQPRLIHK